MMASYYKQISQDPYMFMAGIIINVNAYKPAI